LKAAIQDRALFEYLLRLGDNCLILSQRLSEWCAHGPVLEEDIAMTNVALDLLGHARFWLTYAAEVENAGRDEDKLAYLRDAGEFRNVLLVEQPNSDYAQTTGRQFYFDTWHYFLLRELKQSTDPRIADIAEKALKEVTYHLERSADWVIRLGDGTDESHRRMQNAADSLWMYTGELFEPDAVDLEMTKRGIGADLEALRRSWLDRVEKTFSAATLKSPSDTWMQRGGKQGVHTENLGYILAEMQFLQRAYPGAQW
jgi:ring-1,2-phenylacetyl-CoA epoxidase subunit PaaC